MLCPGLSCDCKALWSLGLTWCHVLLGLNIYCSLSNNKIFVKKNTDKSESLRADRYLRKNGYSGYGSPYLWGTAHRLGFTALMMIPSACSSWWIPAAQKFCWSLQCPKRHECSNAVKCSSACSCLFATLPAPPVFSLCLVLRQITWTVLNINKSNLSRNIYHQTKRKTTTPGISLGVVFTFFFFFSHPYQLMKEELLVGKETNRFLKFLVICIQKLFSPDHLVNFSWKYIFTTLLEISKNL